MIPRDVIVHVGGPGRDCAPGIVLVAGHVSRVRVLRPSGLSDSALGFYDEEGDVRNYREVQWVPTPPAPDSDDPPTWRALDTWHYQHECQSLPLTYHEAPHAAPVESGD